MDCEGASAGEDPLRAHDVPLFTRNLKRPSAAIEAPGAAPAYMGAPSVENFGGLADEVDEQLLYDVIEAEVNEASRGGDCWDAAPAGAAACPTNGGLICCCGCPFRPFRPLALGVRFNLRRRSGRVLAACAAHLDHPRRRLDEHLLKLHRTGGEGPQPDGRRSALPVWSGGARRNRRTPDRASGWRRAHHKLKLVAKPHLPGMG
jgi:hypothetical protein